MDAGANYGVAIAEGTVVPVVGRETKDASHLTPCPHLAFICWLERVLAAADGDENTEALLLGLGAAALCFLLGYAIIVLTKFQAGFFALGLG
ncbi:MAG: hypothetical protein ACE5IQ_12645 [Candidatus Methylomirabilales bacterium]